MRRCVSLPPTAECIPRRALGLQRKPGGDDASPQGADLRATGRPTGVRCRQPGRTKPTPAPESHALASGAPHRQAPGSACAPADTPPARTRPGGAPASAPSGPSEAACTRRSSAAPGRQARTTASLQLHDSWWSSAVLVPLRDDRAGWPKKIILTGTARESPKGPWQEVTPPLRTKTELQQNTQRESRKGPSQ